MTLKPMCACGQQATWKRKTTPPPGSHAADFDHLCDVCWCDLVGDFPAFLDCYTLLAGPGRLPWPRSATPIPASMLPNTTFRQT